MTQSVLVADSTGLHSWCTAAVVVGCWSYLQRRSTQPGRMQEASSKHEFLVIGAGLSRTGTLSTRSALEHLLGGGCYHGSVPVAERQEHLLPWIKVFTSGNLEPETAKELLAGYVAGLDVTVFSWYKQLMEIYPDAKVLLTVRDPERWFTSMTVLHTIFGTLIQQPYIGVLTAMGLGDVGKFTREVLTSPNMPGILGRVNRAMLQGKREAVEVFNSHVAEVKRFVPPDRLLVFDVKDGWAPLCTFLDKPIPDTPFPNVNDATMMLLTFNIIRIVCWLVVLMLPVGLAVLLPSCESLGGVLLVTALLLGIVPAFGRLLLVVVRKHAGKKK